MSMDLVDKCLTWTQRDYPDGYGFALCYLDENLTPSILKNAADDVVLAAFSEKGRREGWCDDSDLTAYVSAIANAKRPEDWLIEGAQLVLQWANYDGRGSIKRACSQALAKCGHPGHDL